MTTTPARSVPRARAISFLGGGLPLTVLGLVFLVAALVNGDGVGLILLSVPALLAGLSVIRGHRWARPVGVAVAAVFTLVIGYVATTPWRGLTAAPGQVREPVDLSLVALTIAFGIAAMLIALGTRPTEER